MCGIAGIYNSQGGIQESEALMRRMLASIRYRGPDESGIYLNSHVTLGSVRLSIIDISSGQQPLASADGRYRIVFNGEIFNYLELKRELLHRGCAFRTESDTEVLLNAYITYGKDCLNRLNGQFVFAIWDNVTGELFLARDRVGIRPLFYTQVRGELVFGSEIKSLFQHEGVKATLDMDALSQVFSYWTTITPRSVFTDILELPPGYFMHVKGDDMNIQPFWKLTFPDSGSMFRGSFSDAVEALEELLTDSIRIRLRADVTVAAYLSGGLDSSTTTALIKKIMPETLQTFSIGFEDEEFDETPFQREVSSYLDTRHTAFTCTRAEIGELFPRIIWHSEIPVLRTAPVPMYCLSKKVRESGIKVVITGEGADEMFAGYDIFKEGIIREFWAKQPGSVIRPLLFKKLYPYLAQFKGRDLSFLRLFYGYRLNETESPFYSHLLRWHNTSGIRNFFVEDFKTSPQGKPPFDEVIRLLPPGFDSYDTLAKSQWLESVIFMSGYLLSSQGDRMGMANSVEGRYPFLDYRIIEFAASLPPDFKMKGLDEKFIIKKMMDKRLPDSVLKRPKQAYRAPVAGSFFSQGDTGYAGDLLSESGLRKTGVFDPVPVQRLLQKIRSGQMVSETDNMALAGILSTQILIHQFILKDDFLPGTPALENCRIYRENA